MTEQPSTLTSRLKTPEEKAAGQARLAEWKKSYTPEKAAANKRLIEAYKNRQANTANQAANDGKKRFPEYNTLPGGYPKGGKVGAKPGLIRTPKPVGSPKFGVMPKGWQPNPKAVADKAKDKEAYTRAAKRKTIEATPAKKKYKGKYIGPDKYKGRIPAHLKGKYKGSYFGKEAGRGRNV